MSLRIFDFIRISLAYIAVYLMRLFQIKTMNSTINSMATVIADQRQNIQALELKLSGHQNTGTLHFLAMIYHCRLFLFINTVILFEFLFDKNYKKKRSRKPVGEPPSIRFNACVDFRGGIDVHSLGANPMWWQWKWTCVQRYKNSLAGAWRHLITVIDVF